MFFNKKLLQLSFLFGIHMKIKTIYKIFCNFVIFVLKSYTLYTKLTTILMNFCKQCRQLFQLELTKTESQSNVFSFDSIFIKALAFITTVLFLIPSFFHIIYTIEFFHHENTSYQLQVQF